MNGFALVGAVLSISALAFTGSITGRTMLVVVLLLPTPVLGYALSRLLNRVLDPRRLRRTAIGVSCFGAIVLIGQQLIG
jgi:fumarate reductase subunit D